jgi:hypothetical protein
MDSAAFERHVERVHQLLDGTTAQVTWNDHVPDPDNPEQQRQIDVTIRRGDELTLVECRHRRAPQSVQWIEELIGRQASLRATHVIAVSSSGFTVGACKKAHRFGIITRDLQSLTDAEVRAWGGKVALTLYCYQYEDIEVTLLFSLDSMHRVDQERVREDFRASQVMLSVFNTVAMQLDNLKLLAQERFRVPVRFSVTLQMPDLRISGEPIIALECTGKGQLVPIPVLAMGVIGYGAPGQAPDQREATVEFFDLGETAVVHDQQRISVVLDVSGLTLPPLCQFRMFHVVGEEEMEHESMELMGAEKLFNIGGRIGVNLAAELPA